MIYRSVLLSGVVGDLVMRWDGRWTRSAVDVLGRCGDDGPAWRALRSPVDCLCVAAVDSRGGRSRHDYRWQRGGRGSRTGISVRDDGRRRRDASSWFRDCQHGNELVISRDVFRHLTLNHAATCENVHTILPALSPRCFCVVDLGHKGHLAAT